MATIRKRGDKWQVQIKKKINGQEVRESNTFLTKGEAQAWATMREADLIDSDRKGLIVGNKHTLYDALIKYRDEIASKKKSVKWLTTKINNFIDTLPFVGELITSIKPVQYAEFRDKRLKTVKNSTVIKELGILSVVYSKAIKEWGWCSVNPISNIEKPRKTKHRNRLISNDEIDAILSILDYKEGDTPTSKKQELAYIFLIAIETAMRQGEILSLTYDAVFLDKRFVHLDKTKNGDTRDVPLSNRAVYLFEQVLKNKHEDNKLFTLSSASADAMFRKYRNKLGINDLHFHDTRHEAITRLSKKLGVLELARMVGHRNISQLMTYYNETAESLASKLG
ncbi:site-specific integrase [Entomomonas moraniae]|uniref:Site-specific integrase n=1 Tax=Entomomonas moraniae TaxID=2213226 RepID=A0A3Q9JGZ5_9GAMM|nr:site-specific integrase [Entomomonas moraniae]AZS49306.1 site-specific integrase [Entomomonas moraniae]